MRGEQATVVSPLGDREAVQLFVDRASARGARLRPDATEIGAAVSEICRRLDRLPLAIELAAARLRGVSLRQIADRLDDRFRLLGWGRTSNARSRCVVELRPARPQVEQSVFCRASRSSLTASTSTRLKRSPSAEDAVLPLDVVDVVPRLVEKSLLVTVRVGGDYRYRMLETLRQYGRTQIQHAGEKDAGIAPVRAWALAPG